MLLIITDHVAHTHTYSLSFDDYYLYTSSSSSPPLLCDKNQMHRVSRCELRCIFHSVYALNLWCEVIVWLDLIGHDTRREIQTHAHVFARLTAKVCAYIEKKHSRIALGCVRMRIICMRAACALRKSGVWFIDWFYRLIIISREVHIEINY